MIKVTLTNEILKYITEIEQNRYKAVSYTHLDVYKRQLLNLNSN